jgi:hypothetical protein
MTDHDMWIWHTYFDIAGSHNDICVLQCSPLFSRLVLGHALDVNYEINNHYKGYSLANGIYTKWLTFGKIICDPFTKKKASFSKCQESHKKDNEWAFYVLQSQFSIMWCPNFPMVDDSYLGCHGCMFDHV